MDKPTSEMTNNYVAHKKIMSELSVTDLVRAYDYINTLSQFVPNENEVLDDLREIIEPLEKIINTARTEELCPHCRSELFLSDLPQYDYVCIECEENFYSFETLPRKEVIL